MDDDQDDLRRRSWRGSTKGRCKCLEGAGEEGTTGGRITGDHMHSPPMDKSWRLNRAGQPCLWAPSLPHESSVTTPSFHLSYHVPNLGRHCIDVLYINTVRCPVVPSHSKAAGGPREGTSLLPQTRLLSTLNRLTHVIFVVARCPSCVCHFTGLDNPPSTTTT